eukprot:CAMPEP_0170754008 /NCGR_PEP_ID=MMETSP0437-20130122/12784_1 /TAXON_ID=0 /ORGANISM="Sexangularia sp." /LENGTH=72 /DNA_ID=CAMNT_0011093139 /DNA_START=474 /DNA_END=692 /DNA_ORIENTATION=+
MTVSVNSMTPKSAPNSTHFISGPSADTTLGAADAAAAAGPTTGPAAGPVAGAPPVSSSAGFCHEDCFVSLLK